MVIVGSSEIVYVKGNALLPGTQVSPCCTLLVALVHGALQPMGTG